MPVRLRERRSRLAVWAQRFSLVAIPVLVIAAFGHRAGLMDATPTYVSMAVGFGLAALGVIAAIAAFEGIWRDGRKGIGPALSGLLLGLAILVVPMVGAWKLVVYPRLTDISTDLDDPPDFVLALVTRPADAAPIQPIDEDAAELQREAYPDIVSRHYPVGTARVFEDALKIVEAGGWTMLGSQRPEEPENVGRIEAMDTTLLFGFRQDIVIRIIPDGEGALVDMRSAARNGAHDLGENAARIRGFFAALDASLQGITE
ncbi:MAG: DUF1499 domain-containing protein [Rhizobiales bacterium]|nr:DUF1499 domain-containing protein [Hyphomicrobiales bacterium]